MFVVVNFIIYPKEQFCDKIYCIHYSHEITPYAKCWVLISISLHDLMTFFKLAPKVNNLPCGGDCFFP